MPKPSKAWRIALQREETRRLKHEINSDTPSQLTESLVVETKVFVIALFFTLIFFYRFHNLVTLTLVHLFHFSLVILVFHLAFTLSTCYSTNDSYELL